MAELNLVFEGLAGMNRLFKGLIEATAGTVIFPTMIRAPQAVLLRDTVNQIGPAVRAVSLDQAEPSLSVFEQHQFFAENLDELRRMASQFRRRSNGIPVAAQEIAHRRSCPNSRQSLIIFLAQHAISCFGFALI
jgi:hypothetical protein